MSMCHYKEEEEVDAGEGKRTSDRKKWDELTDG
jgi:hypothetical protein